MMCVRCAGFVVSDQYLGQDGVLHMRRCINCGAIRESRMDVHRERPLPIKRKEPRPPCGASRQAAGAQSREMAGPPSSRGYFRD